MGSSNKIFPLIKINIAQIKPIIENQAEIFPFHPLLYLRCQYIEYILSSK